MTPPDPHPDEGDAPPGIVGSSPAMQEVFRSLRLVAPTQETVLIVGETGTGKELIAHAAHTLSPRREGPYVRVNCCALNENLLESELFGHVKGAFTGAIENKIGRFEAAHGGTIFLDEISSMSPKLQVKLLRVLQEGEFERVGESRTVRVDTRVVAATNQLLEEEVDAGRFREDLYYRLNVVPIYLPPLRERRDDIPALAAFFMGRHAERNNREAPELTPAFVRLLQGHDWPGNVRELEHYLARAFVLSDGRALTPEVLAPPGRTPPRWRPTRMRGGDLPTLVRSLVRVGVQTLSGNLYDQIVGAVERELIEQVMVQCDGTQTTAARKLGINRNTLHKKVTDYERLDNGKAAHGDGAAPPAVN